MRQPSGVFIDPDGLPAGSDPDRPRRAIPGRVDAVVINGRIVSPADPSDEFLTPGDVAERFGTHAERPKRWAGTYGPTSVHPYPAHVPGQHLVLADGVVRVLTSAVDRWYLALGKVQHDARANARWPAVGKPDRSG